MKYLAPIFLFLLTSVSASAAEVALPDVRKHNVAILDHTPEADGVFVVQNDGTVRHVQSGIVCPAAFPNVNFWHMEVFPNTAGRGLDVGCDYGRASSNGRIVSKLTIFATKLAKAQTVDQVFEAYRDQLKAAHPNAVELGPAIKVGDEKDTQGPRLPDFRSAEFVETTGGGVFTDDLAVALRGDWVLEVRSTYEGEPNEVEMTKKEGVDGAVLATGDRLMLSSALLAVVGAPAQ